MIKEFEILDELIKIKFDLKKEEIENYLKKIVMKEYYYKDLEELLLHSDIDENNLEKIMQLIRTYGLMEYTGTYLKIKIMENILKNLKGDKKCM